MRLEERLAFEKFSKGLSLENRKFLIKEYKKMVRRLEPISQGGQKRCIS